MNEWIGKNRNNSKQNGSKWIKMDHIKHNVQFLSLLLSMFSIYKARENSMTTQKKISLIYHNMVLCNKTIKKSMFFNTSQVYFSSQNST